MVAGCYDGAASDEGTAGASSTGGSESTSVATSGSATATATATAADSGSSGGPADSSSDSGSADSSSSGSADSSSGGIEGTTGCSLPLAIATAEWVPMTVDVDGITREYFVYLPEGYDPVLPYPVVYQFHGCSDSEDRQSNNVPVHDYSGSDAIIVRGKAIESCWDTAPDGSGVALFDAMVPEVESQWCADPARRFVTGYSSGSFMTHRLACVRGDMIRGVASIAGGQGGNDCVGEVAGLLIHDSGDPMVNISTSEAARDRLIEANGCDAGAPTTPTAHPPCEAYAGCDPELPVVWCQTMGEGHGRQDAFAGPAFWEFLAALE
jgi:polyhydroxybutyrate depolymerase